MPNENELLKYYITHTDKRFEEVHRKLDKLISFRWLLIGISIGVSGVVSFVVKIIEASAGR